MIELLFATTNKGKLAEASELANLFGIKIIGPSELGLGAPPEVEENGATYHENAQLKSEALHAWSAGLPTFGDDSGVEVSAINGRPGLYSARYAGIGCSSADNRTKLLAELTGASDRSAVLKCILCLKHENGPVNFFEGRLPGQIATQELGTGGFGYDSLFIPDGYAGLTLAQLKERRVTVRTHRYLALEALCQRFKK